MPKQFTHRAVVTVSPYSGGFPIDMLRYDRAYPVRGEDAARIAETFDRQRKPVDRPGILIETRSESRNWQAAVTPERLASFGVGIRPAET